ncbi:hypothetical protein CBM2614_B190073 [Cupriavidus taiwanensis]|nr:hypothetical protein CBM2614_B190073 [Cupriavidus taiwanensis]
MSTAAAKRKALACLVKVFHKALQRHRQNKTGRVHPGRAHVWPVLQCSPDGPQLPYCWCQRSAVGVSHFGLAGLALQALDHRLHGGDGALDVVGEAPALRAELALDELAFQLIGQLDIGLGVHGVLPLGVTLMGFSLIVAKELSQCSIR